MKKLIFPVILLALLSGCGLVTEKPDTDKDVNIVSNSVNGTTTDVLTYETVVTTGEASTVDATTTKTAGNKVSGSTTAAHSTNKVTSPTITRATAANDGVVHGTTRSVLSVQRTTTTASSSSTTATEPTTQTATFDPKDYSKISLAFDTKSDDNNEIKVMRPDKNGEEVTVQVLRDVDTSEIAEAIEKDHTKKLDDFIVKADFNDDGYPDLFIIEKQDELNKSGRYYRYDYEKGIYTTWPELNSLKNLVELDELNKGAVIVYDKKDDNIEYESRTYEWNGSEKLVLKSSIHQYTDEEGEIRIEYVYYDNDGEVTSREIRNKEGEIVSDGKQNPTEPTSDDEPSGEKNYN